MKQKVQPITTPAPSECCAKCFYKFDDVHSETGFYCIKLHQPVSDNESC